MRNCRKYLAVWLAFAGLACVGTDYINDPPGSEGEAEAEAEGEPEPSIVITPSEAALLPEETMTFTAIYYDEELQEVEGVAFSWTTSDETVATIDAAGLATPAGPGQVDIIASAEGISSSPALLTIVEGTDDLALITLTPQESTIGVGETLQLVATGWNVEGDELPLGKVTWVASTDAVSVDSQGLCTGQSAGSTMVTAEADGVTSLPVSIEVFQAGDNRSGQLMPKPGSSYTVQGTVTLMMQSDGSVTVELGDDFASSSGPQLAIFLSTSSSVGPGSINVGDLQSTSGAQSYQTPAGTGLETYDFVVVHCVPFNVTFGFGELN